LREITPGGAAAAKQLRKLIDLKDTAHNGFLDVSRAELRQAMRRARSVLEFADNVLGGD